MLASIDGAPNYESGGQEFESLRARHKPLISRKNFGIARSAMQNEKICMAFAWQIRCNSPNTSRAETESAILFQPRKRCATVIFIIIIIIIISGIMTGIISPSMAMVPVLIAGGGMMATMHKNDTMTEAAAAIMPAEASLVVAAAANT